MFLNYLLIKAKIAHANMEVKVKIGSTKFKISYQKLWVLLVNKKTNRAALRRSTGISAATMAKLGKGESVNTNVLLRICEALDCDLFDIMELEK